MKLIVTLMPPVMSQGSLIHLTKEHDDVEMFEVTERNVLAVSLEGGKSVHYNWAHIRSVEVDEYATVRPNSGLVRP